MDTDREKEILGWVDACLDMSQEDRDAYLQAQCGNDPELIERVCSVLTAFGVVSSFMETVPKVENQDLLEFPQESMPKKIGPYELVRNIGEGGMGTVYLARQAEPVIRDVALKILKTNILGKETLMRFSVEYQALAQMCHPNVARVYDSGLWEDRPYFTMEYFPGEPITEYCNKRRLDKRARLALFLQACSGVCHAHRKLIIHRDLKPSNVMVRDTPDGPALRVIDFGIAKVLEKDRFAHAAKTQVHMIMGTPAYMAGEQVDGRMTTDVRTDVCGLGGILYELLTGVPPYDPKRLAKVGMTEMIRILKDEEPVAPSLRVGNGNGDSIHTREIRGDLDWITLKALARGPERRYESVADLARDVQCFLDDQPVAAGPLTWSYKLKKFSRRHRTALAVVATSILTLCALTMGSLRMQRLSEEASDLQAMMHELSDIGDPNKGGPLISPADYIALGMDLSKTTFEKKPLVLAQEYSRRALSMARLEYFSRALTYADEGIALYREHAPTSPALLFAEENRAFFLLRLHRLSEAEEVYLDLLDRIPKRLGEDHDLHINAKVGYGFLLNAQGNYVQADRYFRDLHRDVLVNHGVKHPKLSIIERSNAFSLMMLGETERAGVMLAEVLQRQREHQDYGPNHIETLETRHHVVLLAHHLKQHAEVTQEIGDLWYEARKIVGPMHPITLRTLNSYGANLIEVKRFREALDILEEGKRNCDFLLPNDHLLVLGITNNLALVYGELGMDVKVAHLWDWLVSYVDRALPPFHDTTLRIKANAADYFVKIDCPEEAESRMEHLLLAIDEADISLHYIQRLIVLVNLAEAYRARGRTEDAMHALIQVNALYDRSQPGSHKLDGMFVQFLGSVLIELERWDDAEEIYEELKQRSPYGSDNFHKAETMIQEIQVLRGEKTAMNPGGPITP